MSKRLRKMSVWYSDGVEALRCCVCMRLNGETHREDCPIAETIQIIERWRDDDDTDSMAVLCELMELFGIGDRQELLW